jgi:NAD(P)-dependent dehydrogenase (short-subunit alcohol dehydrogenase family)
MSGFEGKVAIVTGATEGLGESIARELFGRGACVVVAARNGERAVEVAKELDPGGERALAAGPMSGTMSLFSGLSALLVMPGWPGRLQQDDALLVDADLPLLVEPAQGLLVA